MAKVSKKAVKESLIMQLCQRGADVACYLSLINDYMDYYDIVKEMEKDIKKKGTVYTAMGSQGKDYEKNNPNVKLLPIYTKTMLSILKELNLTTTDIAADEDDVL